MKPSLAALVAAGFVALTASTAKAQYETGCYIFLPADVLCFNCQPTSCGSCVVYDPNGLRRCEIATQPVTEMLACNTYFPSLTSTYGATATSGIKRCYKRHLCNWSVEPCDGMTACTMGIFQGYTGPEIEVLLQGPGCPTE